MHESHSCVRHAPLRALHTTFMRVIVASIDASLPP